jgi:hypothetical protein
MPTLALQPLPRHVRDLLQLVLKIASTSLENTVILAIRDLESQLLVQIERTSEGVERQRLRESLVQVEGSRSVLTSQFLASVEAELALLQSPVVMRGQMTSRPRRADEMRLVGDNEIEETSALTDAATRAELQNSLPLFLLGQRFGVLAGRPAFDAETLPVGPQALCRSIRRAVEHIDLNMDVRLLMYRAFERSVMRDYKALVEQLNSDLARNGVLPNLQYVPVRARRVAQNADTAKTGGASDSGLKLVEAPAETGAGTGAPAATGQIAASGARPPPKDPRGYRTAAEERADKARQAAQMLMQVAQTHGGALASDEGYQVLRELLGGRRQLLGKLNSVRERDGQESSQHLVSANDLQEALRGMQSRPAAPVISHGRSTARNINHVKQDMLAMLRRVSPNQEAPALSEEHNDAIDLLGMLYENLARDMKTGSTVSNLLTKLQVPMVRVALQDRTFFTRQDHPARQMLNAVAETGTQWLGEDDADSPLVGQLNSIVDRAVAEYRGDPGVFHTMLGELLGHLQMLSRKAEVAERRHVEAAQGKEKLTVARDHATRSVEALIKGQKLPSFTRTMLSQAWTDVMALTALRQGQDSAQWRKQLMVAEKLMTIAQRPARAPAEQPDPELQRDIEEGLTKVGYPEGDVAAISRRLLNPHAPEEDDSASSRTELTLRLKAQARLGEDLAAKKAKRIPLTSAEQTTLDRLQELPTGTVFEFSGPNGEKINRRLAWFSSATGATLFVNHRGQKFTDLSMDELARQVSKGHATPVEEHKGTMIDRAWEGVLNALRSFAVPEEGAAT